MSSTPEHPRPRQVTTASWLASGASGAMAISAATTMAGLGTLAMQERIEAFITELGLQVAPAQVLPWIRIGLYVAGVAGAIGFVTGIFAAKRDRASRIVLSISSVVVFVAGFFMSPFFAMLAVFGVMMMWSAPANDWFAGRAPAPAPQPVERPQVANSAATSSSLAGSEPTGPQTVRSQQVRYQPSRQTHMASLTTIVFSTAVLLWICMAIVSSLTVQSDKLRERFDADPRFEAAGLTFEGFQAVMVVMLIVGALWAIGAVVLGVLVLRGVEWARIALLISASTAGVMALLATLASPVFLVLVAACALTIWLLVAPPKTN